MSKMRGWTQKNGIIIVGIMLVGLIAPMMIPLFAG